MTSKATILDVTFDNVTTFNALKLIEGAAQSSDPTTFSFINAHYLNVSASDTDYKNALQSSDYIFPDGSGVNIAGKLLGIPIKENVNGTDLLPLICQNAIKENHSIYLLGAEDGVAQKMKNNLESQFQGINIAGAHHGYFDEAKETKKIINQINQKNVDILLIGFGAPNQEVLIQKWKKHLSLGAIIGVGGLFDFYSGDKKRAPFIFRKFGLEWCYRLYLEPRRLFRRYILGNPLFLYRVLKSKFFESRSSFDDNPELAEKQNES
ncbi:MAG: WecB/TagA/CpsF family glycosyltransferase [Lentisphaeraceae bacterium]|nr:WecB/TagA/CpsF family glycosyltransferase [Lentisphaeraceae bacterium]